MVIVKTVFDDDKNLDYIANSTAEPIDASLNSDKLPEEDDLDLEDEFELG